MGKSRKSEPSGCVLLDSVYAIQSALRKQLSQGSLPPKICGFEKERRELLDLIKRTATTGESNSVLVIGPRGGGKSMLIKSVLDEVTLEANVKDNLMCVHLNGLLQTDDKLALKEITRQLHLENTVGDKVFGSFAETLQFLLEALKSGSQSSKPILFVLEEFDLFAFHRNQTLLYNLFDISQSAQTPICVLGVTCRLDVIELLEKRVKSRFSHRQLHMFNSLNFDEYLQLFVVLLCLGDDFPDRKLAAEWNKQIKVLAADKSIVNILKRLYQYTRDVRSLQQLMFYPVTQLKDDHPELTASDFQESMKLMTTDSKASMLHGVSILELCLIISMKHLSDIYNGEPFNFEMVYKEYQKFAQRRSSMLLFDKPVVLKITIPCFDMANKLYFVQLKAERQNEESQKQICLGFSSHYQVSALVCHAFEHLISLELVKPMDNSGGKKVQKEYRLMGLLIHPSQIMTALQNYPHCPTEISQWASCSLAV